MNFAFIQKILSKNERQQRVNFFLDSLFPLTLMVYVFRNVFVCNGYVLM